LIEGGLTNSEKDKFGEEKMQNPGEILKEKRIEKGLSLREVSDEIKISPSFLEAIENNNLHYLPGGFFVRNFIRTYARFLGLNEEEILRAFNLLKEPAETKYEKKLKRKSFLPLLLYALAGIFILFMVFLIENEPEERKESPNKVANLSISEPKPAEVKTEEVKPERIEIIIKAIEDTWVEGDLDGKKVLYKIISKGDEIKLNGKEFVFNVIGKPEGIIVFINGYESIPLGEPGKVAKNIRIDIKNFRNFIKK
jgi:cytoskeletal protein RodZ